MNHYQGLRSRPATSLESEAQLGYRPMIQRIVELLVRFHPSITDQDRQEATSVVFTMLAISVSATTGLIALIVFLIN